MQSSKAKILRISYAVSFLFLCLKAVQDIEIKEAVRTTVEDADSVGNLLYLTLPSLYAVRQVAAKFGTKKRMTRAINLEAATEGGSNAGGRLLHTSYLHLHIFR